MITAVFEPNQGTRLTVNGRSMLMRLTALGSPMTAHQKLLFVRAVNEFLADDDQIVKAPAGRHILPPFRFEPIQNDQAFKVVSEQGFKRLMAGNLQVGSTHHYRQKELGVAHDPREGEGYIFLKGKLREIQSAVRPASQHYLFCTARSARHWQQKGLRKFGPRLVRIDGLQEFSSKIAARIGSIETLIQDVYYSDYKVFECRDVERVNRIAEIIGVGSLTSERLLTLADDQLEWLLDQACLPLLFIKDVAFSPEIERRLAFKMTADLKEPVLRFVSPEIIEHLTPVEWAPAKG